VILLLFVVYEIIANSNSRTLNLCALVVNKSHWKRRISLKRVQFKENDINEISREISVITIFLWLETERK